MVTRGKSRLAGLGLSLLGLYLGTYFGVAFVCGNGRTNAPATPRSQVAMKVGPVPIQLPFMSEPIDGWTFAVSMMGLFLAVAAFGAFQVWRLMFSDELGSYEEIKWGGARPPKEYVEEMKRIEESSPASTLSRERSRVLDSRRWHMLCIYMALGILNQTLWLTFAAIPDATARRYDIPEQYVASLAVLCNAVYVPGSWICTAILRSSGLARVIKFACWLQLLGSLIRFLADAAFRRWSGPFAFLFLFIGQGVAALASPLIMNTPAVFANAWFGRREREGVLAVGALSPIFGQGSGPQRLGSAIAGFVVTGYEAEGTEQLLAGQASLSALMALWTIGQFVDAPGESSQEIRSETFKEGWKLMRRLNFCLILIIFNCGMALAAATLTLFGKIASNCGYTSTEAGIASGMFMVGGVVGSLATGSLLGATRAYRTILRCSIISAVMFGLVFLVMLRPGNLRGLLITTTFFGTFMMSALPALLSNAVEETYPTPADITTALLFNSAILLQVFFIPLSQSVLTSQGDTCASWGSAYSVFEISVAGVGCLLPALLYHGRNNRLLAELEEEQMHEGS
ncbi:slc49a3 [Symbiodinium necroappetens]|uniref:Slc49a3 protein n=1 Tax=Symbiodinium necroappetens TaxID=1628268 RepID=A0A813A213_9DINO|nr:slc49a3 [Symbiodinium necroappetens]